MASSCRKCARWVSRIGSLEPEPPASTPGSGAGAWNAASATSSSKNRIVATAAVVVGSLAAVIALILIVVVVQRKRIRAERERLSNTSTTAPGVADVKGEDDEAAEGEQEKWRAVELVVMAGEKEPTFVAHPVPAFSDTVVVQCPPFTLPKHPE